MRLAAAILLVFSQMPFTAFAAVSSFSFTSPNQFESGVRGIITVQSQNDVGEEENVIQTTCLEIRTTSSSGKFSRL